jgi:VanZ family protein
VTRGHDGFNFSASPRLRVLSLWLPVILWAAFIFFLSSIPYLRIVNGWMDFPLRKIAHFLVYAVLARLLTRAFTGSTFLSWKKIFAWSLVLSMLYACSDEVHQGYVNGRHASVRDVLIDTAGSWAALGFKP